MFSKDKNVSSGIDSRRVPVEKRYAGDHESPYPHHVDRQILSADLEKDLKSYCFATLGHTQPIDNDVAAITRYLENKPPQDVKPLKHDKHASFSIRPPNHSVPEKTRTSLPQSTSKLLRSVTVQRQPYKREQQDGQATIHHDPSESSNRFKSKQRAEDVALYEIRSRMHARPKTSAAACIDYADSASPSASNHTASIRSNLTSYSTPFTSAGITPGLASRPFVHLPTHTKESFEVQAPKTTAFPGLSDEAATNPTAVAQSREGPADDVAQPLQTTGPASYRVSMPNKLVRGSPSQRPPASGTETHGHVSRPGSIRTSFSKGFREYIRPGSSSESIRSFHSTVSTQSRTRQKFSAIKNKLSSASLRSRASSRPRAGYDEGDEYFVDPYHINLDRPLPPLPGLDTFKERHTHIGMMMKRMISPTALRRDTASIVIDMNGNERVMTTEEAEQRQKDLHKAVIEKMAQGSIGSSPTSPVGVVSVHRDGSKANVEGDPNRPITAGSGTGVGSVPRFRSWRDSKRASKHVSEMSDSPRDPRSMGNFVRRLGGRLGWRRKPRVVELI